MTTPNKKAEQSKETWPPDIDWPDWPPEFPDFPAAEDFPPFEWPEEAEDGNGPVQAP